MGTGGGGYGRGVEEGESCIARNISSRTAILKHFLFLSLLFLTFLSLPRSFFDSGLELLDEAQEAELAASIEGVSTLNGEIPL